MLLSFNASRADGTGYMVVGFFKEGSASIKTRLKHANRYTDKTVKRLLVKFGHAPVSCDLGTSEPPSFTGRKRLHKIGTAKKDTNNSGT